MPKRDTADFDSFFLDKYDRYYQYAFYLVQDNLVAEDIVQEVFVKVWERWSSLASENNLHGYVVSMIKHKCLNHLRHVRIKEDYIGNYEVELHEDVFHEEMECIKILLNQLPEKRRQVLLLSIWEEKSYKEIAQQCDITVNTVKDHIKKAYAFLRENAKVLSPNLLYLLVIMKKR
ncbi:MAG: RNA polymerase sigma-70 factor [Marinifilaceae bacterium]